MRRSFVLVVMLLAVALVAAACGGGSAQPTKSATPASPAERGRQLANAQGCLGCHSTTGEVITGPTWKGIYGRSMKLSDGTTVTADDAYITKSILDPDAQIVQGFPAGTMPSFQGVLTADQIVDIIEYIKTLR